MKRAYFLEVETINRFFARKTTFLNLIFTKLPIAYTSLDSRDSGYSQNINVFNHRNVWTFFKIRNIGLKA
jgi:hypothetical protein